MKKYVLAPYNTQLSLATEQTLRDIIKFSSELGFSHIHLPLRASVFSSVQYYLRILRSLTADVLLIPYPAVGNPLKTTKLRILDSKMLNFLSKNVESLIVYVYDLPLEQTAYTKAPKWSLLIDDISFSLECDLFEHADKILVFNKEMARVIKQRYGISRRKFVYYEVLDLGAQFYLAQRTVKKRKGRGIIYAGNLSLERVGELGLYLKKLPAGVDFQLIGPNGEWFRKLDFGCSIKYLGVLTGIEFYSALSKVDFGLVWYPQHLSGYLKFGSSSKFSSYIVAGLPVLVDVHSRYVAEITKKYNVGIVGKNLLDLFIKAKYIDCDNYYTLRNNVISLGNRIRMGYFIKRALRIAMEE